MFKKKFSIILNLREIKAQTVLYHTAITYSKVGQCSVVSFESQDTNTLIVYLLGLQIKLSQKI